MFKPDKILIMRGPGETRAALLADESLIEIVHVRDADAQPGAVYVGCVGERVPQSADVFVNIGLAPHGVLETKGAKFASGQWVAVEVLTPARADKGPKLKLSKNTFGSAEKEPALLKPAIDPVAVWTARYGEANLKAIVAKVTSSDFDEIEEQIQSALERTVSLPSGGRITIEPTKALTAIDIDSGSSAADVANAEAIEAISHHMKLRNLAGHILIDLIPTRARRKFVTQLGQATADDPAQVQIMGLTPSGMIDVIRRRIRPSLSETLCDESMARESVASVAYRALRMACRELIARRIATITLRMAPSVATLLNQRLAPCLDEARAMARGDIHIEARADFAVDRVEVA